MKRYSTGQAAGLMALLLSGCATPEQPPPAAPEPAVTDLPIPEPGVIEEPALDPIPPPPPPPPEPEPTDLVGLEPAQVQEVIGEPTLVRRDGDVQLMQFASAACRFDVVFYEDGPGQPFQARYIEARDVAGKPADAKVCLSELLGGADWPAAFRDTLDNNK